MSNEQKQEKMKNFKDLKTGMIVIYNDVENINVEFVILDKIANDFGIFVNVMNLETRNIEPISINTELGARWTL